MKHTFIGIALLSAALQANAITLDPVGANGEEYNFFFSSFELSYGSVTFGCSLNMTTEVNTSTDTMEVVDTQVSGSYPCHVFSIQNLGTGTISNVSNEGARIDFSGITFTGHTFFECDGESIYINFKNSGSNPSFITIPDQNISNNCSIETDVPLTIVPAESHSGDLNIYP